MWPRRKVADAGYSEQLVYAMEQMRHLNSIGGWSAGIGGRPHPFCLLAQYSGRVAGAPEIELMLRDRSALVRVAGVVAFVERGGVGIDKKLWGTLLTDGERVRILNDCTPDAMTVGKIAAGLQGDRSFLGLIHERPNKALEATPAAVTSPAAQEPRQP
jgi:hypothetical protein